jgi:hypothetical protein
VSEVLETHNGVVDEEEVGGISGRRVRCGLWCFVEEALADNVFQ